MRTDHNLQWKCSLWVWLLGSYIARLLEEEIISSKCSDLFTLAIRKQPGSTPGSNYDFSDQETPQLMKLAAAPTNDHFKKETKKGRENCFYKKDQSTLQTGTLEFSCVGLC